MKRDAHYAPTLDRHRRAVEAARVAREDLDDAKTREGLDCGRRQSDCQRVNTLQDRIGRADRERRSAEADLHEIAQAHQIDARDGEELGLW